MALCCLARSEFDAAGPLELKRVEEKFVRVAPVMELVVRGQVITTTAEHPFYVAGEERFVPAGELTLEDQLVDSQGRPIAIDAIRVTDRLITVYNLRVADFHTYFVGGKLWQFDAWVHNASYAPVSETLSRGAYLRQKYAHLSPDQRAARIAELSEANYGRRIADLESTYGAPGVHSFQKHGVQTGIMSQFRRVQQADFPNPTTGAAGNQTKNASMFLSNRDHYETLAYAIRQKAAGAAGNIPVAFDRTIGVSVTNLGSYANRGPFQIRLTNKASVRFDQLGRFYTAFPEP